MNIVCVAACTAGIAHTYIAREKLIKGAKALGHTIKVETQGTIGTENELQAADISAADVVILAVDVKIKGEERFTNKRIVRVGNDSNLLIVFYVQIMPDDFVMQLHRF
ncbi:PTS fructose transporter subunit IIB [Escherichia coli]|nr:PTS fructose transporter subunit IIB [Escherichia coli]